MDIKVEKYRKSHHCYLDFIVKTMLGEMLEKLERPDMPFLGPNYWILKLAGLILPKNIIGKIFIIFIHEVVTVFVITQYIELYVIRSDLDQVLTNMKISMLSVVCIVKVNTFIFWKKHWLKVINYITEADIYERNNNDEDKSKIFNLFTAYCRRVTYFYWGLVFLTFWTTCFQPLIVYMSSETLRENFKNGTAGFPHIFSSWMPFDKNHAPGNYITIVYHVLLCAYGATIMAAYDSFIVVVMVFFGGKIDLLKDRCKKILNNNEMGVKNTFRELHSIHINLLHHSRLFNSLFSPVMFFYMVMCSLMLCASAYQLTSSTSAGQTLLTAEYLIFGVAQLFVYCWHSNDVLIKSHNLIMGTYESSWWQASLNQRKDLILLTGQLGIKNEFTAGPFTGLTLATFITILKGAYSYYTLLSKK